MVNLVRDLWVLCAGCVCIALPAHAWPGIVTYVSDGDTVWVQPLKGGEAKKIRLLGLDAPEVCQAWGPQSLEALQGVLQGQLVEVKGRHHDTYSRLLAKIFHQGHDVGAWMVAQGHAWSSTYQQRAGPYDALQMQAQNQHLGLFADGQAVPPRVFRKKFGSSYQAGAASDWLGHDLMSVT
jgi:endonuclease YncB( thermonuclease family)